MNATVKPQILLKCHRNLDSEQDWFYRKQTILTFNKIAKQVQPFLELKQRKLKYVCPQMFKINRQKMTKSYWSNKINKNKQTQLTLAVLQK